MARLGLDSNLLQDVERMANVCLMLTSKYKILTICLDIWSSNETGDMPWVTFIKFSLLQKKKNLKKNWIFKFIIIENIRLQILGI